MPRRLGRSAMWPIVVVVLALVGLNLADHMLGWHSVWLGPVGAAGLVLFARAGGLSWAELGLARDTLVAGLRWGGGAIAVVALAYLAGVLIPATQGLFLDDRYRGTIGQALLTALVVIPLGTVLLEEVAFRSVLWGVLSRHVLAWRVLVTTSLLFGLWHVLPAVGSAGNPGVEDAASGLGESAGLAVIIGTVLFTGVGGFVFGELRRRSDSLLASVGLHWATNGLGVLVGLLAWRLTA